jgi:hypothetical protein
LQHVVCLVADCLMGMRGQREGRHLVGEII